MLLATTISALGNGLVLPFLVVYLSEVRHISAAVAGLAIAWSALLSFVGAPLAGWFIDRFGPGPILRIAPLVMAVGVAGWALVQTATEAFIPATITAVGGMGLWSASATQLTRLVSEEQRQRAFGLSFAVLNLGIGIGGLISGLVVDVDKPQTFQLLYLGDALTFVVFAGIMLTLRAEGRPVEVEHHERVAAGGYRQVLQDRAMRRLVLLSTILLTCGYGALEVGFPYFATTIVGVSERVVAFGYVGNTVAIVLGQLLVLRLIQGRSRSRLILLVGILWASSWLVLGAAAPSSGVLAVLLVLAAPVVFAVGETLWQPVAPAIVNDLAPELLRGRYNSLGSLSYSVSGTLGPATAGLLLGAGLSTVWIAAVTVGCVAAGTLGLGLRSVLTPGQDGLEVPVDDETPGRPIAESVDASRLAKVPD